MMLLKEVYCKLKESWETWRMTTLNIGTCLGSKEPEEEEDHNVVVHLSQLMDITLGASTCPKDLFG